MGTELWRMTANHLVSSALSASAYAPSPPVEHCQARQGWAGLDLSSVRVHGT